MARCPFASWDPHGTTPGGAIKPRVAILHVAAVLGFPKPHSGLEWHFWISLKGNIFQLVDTELRADANHLANSFAVSIETEGLGDGKWTPAQIASILRLLRWLNQVHGIPLTVCKTWDGSGVGFHTQFGAPGKWTPVAKSCPGPNRKTQFWDTIVPALALSTPPPPPEDADDMAPVLITCANRNAGIWYSWGPFKTWIPSMDLVNQFRYVGIGGPVEVSETWFDFLIDTHAISQEGTPREWGSIQTRISYLWDRGLAPLLAADHVDEKAIAAAVVAALPPLPGHIDTDTLAQQLADALNVRFAA